MKMLLAFCACALALLCLLAGCKGTPEPNDASDGSSAASGSASSAPSASSLPAEPSAAPSVSIGEISLLPAETLEVFPGLQFRLPEGWTEDAKEEPSDVPGLLFSAASADESRSVNAVFSALEQTTGLTESLLVAELRDTLPARWQDAGAKDVKTAAVRPSFLGETHDALSLTASVNGKTVCQLQLYLLRPDGLYTLTITADSAEKAQALLSSFESV